MAARDQPQPGKSWRGVHRWGVPRGEFFSLGGLLAPYARTPESLTPWLLSAAVLLALASWDPLTTGGRFDAILFGLAAYELLIGLIRCGERQAVRVAAPEAREGRRYTADLKVGTTQDLPHSPTRCRCDGRRDVRPA